MDTLSITVPASLFDRAAGYLFSALLLFKVNEYYLSIDLLHVYT